MGRILVTAFLVLVATAAAHAEPRQFKLLDNQIVMPVKVEGREVLALLDTDASGSSLVASLAYDRSKGARIELGGRTVTRAVSELPANDDIAGKGVKAIIGRDMLADRVLSIDFDHMTIDMTPSRDFKVPPSSPPITLHDRLMPVSINGRDTDVVLDTKASGALYLSKPPSSKSPTALTIAGTTFANVPVTMIGAEMPASKAKGVIGVDLLRQFNIVIDYGRDRAWLTPNKSCGAPLQRNRIGLFLYANAGQGRVRMVAPGSPAARAGFKDGDLVDRIEDATGKPIVDTASVNEGDAITVVMGDGSKRKLVAANYY